MARLRATIANIEIDDGNDPSLIGNVLRQAIDGFFSRPTEPARIQPAAAVAAIEEERPDPETEPEEAPLPRNKPKAKQRAARAVSGDRQGKLDKIEAVIRGTKWGVAKMADIIEQTGFIRGSMNNLLNDARFEKKGRGMFGMALTYLKQNTEKSDAI